MAGKMLVRCTVAAAAASATLLPHTLLLDKYRKYRARYGLNDIEKPVRKDIQQRFQEVMDDINLSEEHRRKIKLFNVYDINVFHAGTIISKHGALVGVPTNFEYKDPDTITQDTITFQDKKVDWDTPAGKNFRQSLVFSDTAQKFAIAQQIFSILNPDPYFRTAYMVLDVFIGFTVYNIISENLRLATKQRLARFFFMGVSAVGSFILWLFTNNSFNYYRESTINERLIKLGPKYVQGGVEYYEKLLNRNKALRVLLGSQGTYLFTSTGNETAWCRQRAIPVSTQADNFKLKLDSMQLV